MSEVSICVHVSPFFKYNVQATGFSAPSILITTLDFSSLAHCFPAKTTVAPISGIVFILKVEFNILPHESYALYIYGPTGKRKENILESCEGFVSTGSSVSGSSPAFQTLII